MNRLVKVVSVAGLGAGLMYLFDPDRGKRRRALLRDKMRHAARVTKDVTGKTRRGVSNHLVGVVAEIESVFKNGEVSDDVLAARVRSKLGRIVSRPGAIEVKVVGGSVTLSGPIPASEQHPLLESVINIRGVKNIENQLELLETPGLVPPISPSRGNIIAVTES